MKEVKDTVGGWMWYVTNVKTELSRPLSEKENKEVLQKYIAGKPWQKTVEEMK